MKEHLAATIYGQVQGVFFRASAKDEADRLSLTGFVCNLPDGTVYLEAEGEEGQLRQLLEWCWIGPPAARVDKVEFEFSNELKNFSNFVVRG